MHLIIHKAHEQAIAFAKVFEFTEYENLFYGGTFITHISTCESDLLDNNLNQNDDILEEIDKADCELNEISKAAELVSIYNILNLEEADDFKQNQIEIDFIYNQSDKKIIQKNDEISSQKFFRCRSVQTCSYFFLQLSM